MKSEQKIKNIEFLRILFVLIIVVGHCLWNVHGSDVVESWGKSIASSNSIANSFFIIAGFFFMLTFKPGLSCYEFLRKKALRMCPMLFLFVLSMWTLAQYNVANFRPLDGFVILSFLNSVGLTQDHGLTAWFTCVLFWGLLFFYMLKKSCSDLLFKFLTGIFIFFSIVTLYKDYPDSGGTNQIMCGFLSAGILRSCLCVGLGIFVFEFLRTNQTDSSFYTPAQKTFYSLLEIASIAFLLSSFFRCFHIEYTYCYLLSACYLLISFIQKRGFLGRLCDNNLSVILGRYSFSIYIIHWAIMKLWLSIFWFRNITFVKKYPVTNFFLLLFVIALFSVLAYHLVEKSKKCRKWVFLCVAILAGGTFLFHKTPLEYDHQYKFDSIVSKVVLTNRSEIDWAAWLRGQETKMSFYVPSREPTKAVIKVFSILSPNHPTQRIRVLSDGKELTSLKFRYGRPQDLVEFTLPRKRKQEITIVTDNPISPKNAGVAIESLTITKITSN